MNPLRISVVSYLNALPFREGLRAVNYPGFVITDDIPSVCAAKLLNGEADLGLVPVAMYPLLREKGGNIVTDYCIGADGEVASVMLFSNVPVQEVTRVYLDKESRTSITLFRILAKYHWKREVEILQETDVARVEGTTARILIGDRALLSRGIYPHETDLAAAWKTYCGLPFVFACWVCMRTLTQKEMHALETAFQKGMEMRNAIAEKMQESMPRINLKEYLFQNIRYRLSAEARKGLLLFLKELDDPANHSLLPFSRL